MLAETGVFAMVSARRWMSTLIVAVGGCYAPAAFAQYQDPAPMQAQGQVGVGAAPAAQAAPAAPAAPAAAAEQGGSDHDAVVGTLGVGFLGRRSMRLGFEQDPGSNVWPDGSIEIDAPVIGIRYWVHQMVGIDAGVGFVYTSGEATQQTMGQSATLDEAGIFAFILHAGVPLSLASAQHFSFQIVPELNVGFASQTIEPAAGAMPAFDIENKGFHFDIGARAGAEIHFGFIDVPQLSLQGSVGVLFETDSFSSTLKSAPEEKYEASHTSIGTTVGDSPWNIFLANVAALYYF
jgi:hypothetical protein